MQTPSPIRPCAKSPRFEEFRQTAFTSGTEASRNRASWVGLSEIPAARRFYWYLVRGVGEQGEGASGFFRTTGGQILARVENGSGACP